STSRCAGACHGAPKPRCQDRGRGADRGDRRRGRIKEGRAREQRLGLTALLYFAVRGTSPRPACGRKDAQTTNGIGAAVEPIDTPPTAATGRPDDYHASESQEIVVTGYARNRADILSGSSVVSGDDLAREQRPTIGDTLARLPGVSATSFGPNASRPVLRGFQ